MIESHPLTGLKVKMASGSNDNSDKKDQKDTAIIPEDIEDKNIESDSSSDNNNNNSSDNNSASGLASATAATTTQSPRRSARLMNKRERESNSDNMNTEGANMRNTRTREDNPNDTTRSTANESTSRPSSGRPTAPRTNPSTFMPVISFTFGISGPVGRHTTVPFGDLPEDIQQIHEMFGSQGLGQGQGAAFGGSFVIPMMVRPRSSGTNGNGVGGDELLQVARQMFQIIAQSAALHSSLGRDELPEVFEPLLNELFNQLMNQPQGPAGLTDAQIARLPILKAADDEVSEIDCAICRETTRVDAGKCVKLGCKHCFHFDCIEPWLKRVPSCPICRHVVNEEENE